MTTALHCSTSRRRTTTTSVATWPSCTPSAAEAARRPGLHRGAPLMAGARCRPRCARRFRPAHGHPSQGSEGTHMRLTGKKIGVFIESDYYEDEIFYYRHRFPEEGVDLHFFTRLWGQESLTF